MLFGVYLSGERFFLLGFPEREFIGGDEKVDWLFLQVELGNDGIGSGVDYKVVGALKGDRAKETHVDLIFDIGEHVRGDGLKRNFIFGEHFNVVERFFWVLLGNNNAEFLSFSFEVAKNILHSMAVVVDEDGFLVGFDFFGESVQVNLVFLGFADEFVDERDDFLAICWKVVLVPLFVADFLHLFSNVVEIVEDNGVFGLGTIENVDDLFHLYLERFDGFDSAAFERVDECVQNEQIEVFSPNVAFDFFENGAESVDHVRTLNGKESTRLRFQGPKSPMEMRI